MGLIERLENSMFDRVSRRIFLKAGAVLAGEFFMASMTGCLPKQQPLTLEQQIALELSRLRTSFIRNEKEKLGMEFRQIFPLSSGVYIYLYTNRSQVHFDQSEIDKAFHAGFTVLDDQRDTSQKAALQKARERAQTKGFNDHEVHLLVSGISNSCIGENGNLSIVPAYVPAKDVCVEFAFTGSALTFERNNMQKIPEARLLLMVLTPGAVNGKSHFHPAGTNFELTPEQALASHLSHEAMHGFLRMTGYPQDKQPEERFVQEIERDLLLRYSQNPLDRPRSFQNLDTR